MRQIGFLMLVVGLVTPGLVRAEVVAEVASPDGRNSIRLLAKPLGYEVRRDGKVLVPFSPIGLQVDGVVLKEGADAVSVADRTMSGRLKTPVYKRESVDLACNGKFVGFGTWGVALAARNDGAAWRFELKRGGTIDGECASVSVPSEAKALVYKTDLFGCEERIPQVVRAKDVTTGRTARGEEKIYLPFVFETSGRTVAVTESDLCDYPCWYLERGSGDATNAEQVTFASVFARWPKKTRRTGGPDETVRGRKEEVIEREDYLVKATGPRTLPWRVFVLADEPAKLCESDAVNALARPAADRDWSWVRPGKVQWDWWNAFHNVGEPEGCTTEAYVRYIDFAAEHGVEYVIFDEGWSEKLNIWKFSPSVDVQYLLEYASKRGIGIILWMAWAQAVGEEARVAETFAKMGVKGFKVDFMDRGDAQVERFLWTFAEECAKNRLLVDYHGVHRPAGLSRTYPNVLNYEAVHGLEQMKWYRDGSDKMFNDVAAFFGRMTAGPMDYTPGAIDNYPIGGYPKVTVDPVWKDRIYRDPGSVGTRCHQMAMMVLYEAPLQMLADAPAKYAKNLECFRFMAETPVVWAETVGLAGSPDTYALAARRGYDGSWHLAAINNAKARTISVPTAFLGSGTWTMTIFRDAHDAAEKPTHYIRETRTVKAGEPLSVSLSPGGGFVAKMQEVREGCTL